MPGIGRGYGACCARDHEVSAEGWPVDDFDVHDQVVDHIEDEHSRPVQLSPTFRWPGP